MREPRKERLQQTFNRHVESQRTLFAGYGADKAIESLSSAIRELQEIGLDVHLDLHSSIIGAAFDLVTKVGGNSDMRLITSGTLSIAGEERLVTLSISEQNKETLNFYVSDRYYGGKTLDDDYRGSVFNLKSSQAVVDLQDSIMEIAAKKEVINSCDIGSAFGLADVAISRLPKMKA